MPCETDSDSTSSHDLTDSQQSDNEVRLSNKAAPEERHAIHILMKQMKTVVSFTQKDTRIRVEAELKD
jgi:hypothetical protein